MIYPTKYKVDFYRNVDGAITKTTLEPPRCQVTTIELPVAPETGKASITLYTGVAVEGTSGGSLLQNWNGEPQEVMAYAESLQGAFLVIWKTPSANVHTLPSDPPEAQEPVYSPIFVGKVFSVNTHLGSLSGEMQIEATDFSGWLDQITFDYAIFANEKWSSGDIGTTLSYDQEIPDFNELVRGKMSRNKANTSEDGKEINLDSWTKVKGYAFACGDDKETAELRVSWKSKDICQQIKWYLESVYHGIFSTVPITVKFTDKTDKAFDEVMKIGSRQSFWKILTELFNRKNSLVLTNKINNNSGAIEVEYIVESMLEDDVNYKKNTNIIEWSKDNFPYHNLLESPTYQVINSKYTNIMVQTKPISVITTLNLDKHFAPAWDTSKTYEEEKVANGGLFSNVGTTYELKLMTNYLDPEWITDATKKKSGGWTNNDAYTLHIGLDPLELTMANWKLEDSTRKRNWTNRNTVAIDPEIKGSLGAWSQFKEGATLVDSIIIERDGTNWAKSEDYILQSAIGGQIALNMNKSDPLDITDAKVRENMYLTVQLTNMAPIYTVVGTAATSAQEQSTLCVTLPIALEFIDQNSIIGLDEDDKPLIYSDIADMSGSATSGNRWVLLNTDMNLEDVWNKLNNAAAFYNKKRTRLTYHIQGIWDNVPIGAYLKKSVVCGSSIDTSNGIKPKNDREVYQIDTETIITKVTYNFNDNYTIIYTDYSNYN